MTGRMRKSRTKLDEKVLAGVDGSTMKPADDDTESDATNSESSDDDGEEDVLHVNALQPASDNDDATDSSDEEVRREMPNLSESTSHTGSTQHNRQCARSLV